MSYYANLDGERIISGNIYIPYTGIWCAELTLALAAELNDFSTLTIGDLVLNGTNIRYANYAGSRSTRIVGGYGGWRKEIQAFSYNFNQSVPYSLILKDITAKCGEKINNINNFSSIYRTGWVTEKGYASNSLNILTKSVDKIWYINNSGETEIVDDRAHDIIKSNYTVMSYSGSKGIAVIASENISDWMPGKKWSNITVSTEQTIDSVNIRLTSEGKCRIEVQNA